MPRNPLDAHPPWRQLLIIATVVPVIVTLAVLAFAWPTARIAPNDLPVGLVGTGTASQHAALALTQTAPGGFQLHLYSDPDAARAAIRNRTVYGAIDITPTGLTLYTADAASPTVAQLLTNVAQHIAADSGKTMPVTFVDVVPLASTDPHGAVFSATILPLVLGAEILAVVVAALVGFKPAWRQLTALLAGAAAIGGGAYLIAQTYLGTLPGNGWATWAALAATVFAISTTTAGLFDLLGGVGIGIGAALMIFVGNPFSGVTSAPQLLPNPVGAVGQWLPPGAGGSLIRDTAYFAGHGATQHIVVLGLWCVFGIVAIVVGHRRTGRHELHRVHPAVRPAGVLAPELLGSLPAGDEHRDEQGSPTPPQRHARSSQPIRIREASVSEAHLELSP